MQYTSVIKAIKEKQNKSWVLNSSDNPCRDYISVSDPPLLPSRDLQDLCWSKNKILLAKYERRHLTAGPSMLSV